jgi:hypothetical protein
MKQSAAIGILFAANVLLAQGASAEAPPAAKTGQAAAAQKATAKDVSKEKESDNVQIGLTIVGDKESPVGLFITPWKNAYAGNTLDRPALLLDEVPLPLDPDVFRRQVSYHELIAAYKKSVLPATAPQQHP